MIKKSLFKMGLIMTVIGIIWSAYVFSDNQMASEIFYLDVAETSNLELKLEGNDIGFYKVSLPSLGDSVFAQILNSKGSIIADKKLETKSAINYFDFEYSDDYTLKITNLSEHPLVVNVEFGQTNVSEMRYSGIMILVGIIVMITVTFRKLQNYKIAQPDEKIS